MLATFPRMTAFTVFHVVLSLVAILAGFMMVGRLLSAVAYARWTACFFWTTLATTVTGFFFPFRGFTPAIAFGIVSLPVLALTWFARSARKLAGPWRWIFVLSAMFAFYLNFFVLIVQSFLHIPFLKALAPTQTEPPFALAQLAGLLLFVALTIAALRKFHPPPANAV